MNIVYRHEVQYLTDTGLTASERAAVDKFVASPTFNRAQGLSRRNIFVPLTKLDCGCWVESADGHGSAGIADMKAGHEDECATWKKMRDERRAEAKRKFGTNPGNRGRARREREQRIAAEMDYARDREISVVFVLNKYGAGY